MSDRLGPPSARWRRDPITDAYVVAGVVFVALILMGVVAKGADAKAYWLASMPDPYSAQTYGVPHAFYYSPVIAQLLQPFRLLPFNVFYALIGAANLVALRWLVGRWAPAALLFPPVAIEFYDANINLWIAVAIVLALTGRPSAWALPLLTKIAPGIGILWHGVRREWRALAVAMAFTATIAGISYLAAPATWSAWFELLGGNVGMAPPQGSLPIPLLYRLPFAVGLIVIGARTNHAWLVPIATVLAIPVLWQSIPVLLVACVRLRSRPV